MTQATSTRPVGEAFAARTAPVILRAVQALHRHFAVSLIVGTGDLNGDGKGGDTRDPAQNASIILRHRAALVAGRGGLLTASLKSYGVDALVRDGPKCRQVRLMTQVRHFRRRCDISLTDLCSIV